MENNKVIIFSNGIRNITNLSCFLEDIVEKEKVVVGWGNKPNTKKARDYASSHGLKYYALEDGFLRSIGLGSNSPPLSLVVDDLGIYYDYHKPSRLEAFILDKHNLVSQLSEAQRAIDLILDNHLSKYNESPERLPQDLNLSSGQTNILIVDQTAGDMSLKYGGCSPETFQKMYAAALSENPDATIWIKIHPDVLVGKKKAHFNKSVGEARVHFIADNINPIVLLKHMDKVYVCTSQLGFEALMLHKKVITFGVPWYSGWGLTDDRHLDAQSLAHSSRRRQASLLELFTAAYLQYPRYLNPFTKEKGTIFDVIEYLTLMKRREKQLAGMICCIGLSWWKRKVLLPFIQTRNNDVRFYSSLDKLQRKIADLPVEAHASVLLWGKKHPEVSEWARQKKVPLLRMEDGFIRSVGLGSNLVSPMSLVIDDQGIYFDSTAPSKLESLLQNYSFSSQDVDLAKTLIERIISHKISKYNVGKQNPIEIDSQNRKVILVPGQVENDASIIYGSKLIKKNIDLIKLVRSENPDAFIIYKPHPDVVSGNREGGVSEENALQYVNKIEANADILDLIELADELHTITSLSGFEALLRGKKVTCYGAPFYSGWGLTKDKQKVARRTRKLNLFELVYATLVLYPTYIHPQTKEVINAETALDLLESQRKLKNQYISSNWFKRKYNQLSALYRAMR